MDREQIERQIDELTQLLEEVESEGEFSPGDMVEFSYEGEDLTGEIENVAGQTANVRVMAVSGDDFEPTDKVLEMNVSELSAMNADGGEDDETEETEDTEEEEIPEEDEEDEDEEEEKSITEGSYVEFMTTDGLTKGKVVLVSDEVIVPETEQSYKLEKGQIALIHVLQEKDGWEETGVHVAHPVKDITAISPIEEKSRKLMVKMKDYKLEYDDEEEKYGRFKGLGSSYGKVDLGGDTVDRGAYNQTLEHNDYKIQLMFDHGYKVRDYAGIAELESTDEGLMVDAKMPLHIGHVKDAFEMIKFLTEEGKAPGLSIGYRPVKWEHRNDGTRVLKEIALDEMSITPFPMDTHARIRDAKNRKIAYNGKRSAWQTLRKTKTATPDAPTGNQNHESDYKSFCELLTEITT